MVSATTNFSCTAKKCEPTSGSKIEAHYHGSMSQIIALAGGHGTANVDIDFVAIFGYGCDSNSVKILKVDTPSNDGKTPNSDKSFVSSDTVTFHAKVDSACGNTDLEWTSSNTATSGSLAPQTLRAQQYAATPSPPAASGGRAASLTYTVTVTANKGQDQTTIVQDEIDKIRQQYIDMSKNRTPVRHEFIDSGQSSAGHFTFAEIRSNDGAPWAVFSIFEDLETWRSNYGGSLTITRGYSTPRYNATIPGAATNSQHIYGTATDVLSNHATWGDLKQAAKDAGACTEPLQISTYSHVHGDWRGGCPAGW
jgi:hypothetical protein